MQSTMWDGATGDRYHGFGRPLSAQRKITREQTRKTKTEFVTEYGGECYCCGEKDLKLLTVEHLFNDGNKVRKRLRKNVKPHKDSAGGTSVLGDLKRRNWPKHEGITVACSTCNVGRDTNLRYFKSDGFGSKHCPHGFRHRIVRAVEALYAI